MRAIRVHQFGSPEVMQLEEIPAPQPGAGEVLMRVHAIGVNPFDTRLRAGEVMKPPLPFIPGEDAAGVIEAVGAGVTSVKVGDRVYGGQSHTGTYAELLVYKESEVYPLPERISFSQGAGIKGPYFTAHYALFGRGRGTPGETVLVHGASGGVGIASVQIARMSGFHVIGTASSQRGRALVLDSGAHAVVDHSDSHYIDQLLELTQGRRFDLILEMKSDVNLAPDAKLIAPGGRIVMIGGQDVGEGMSGRAEFNPFEILFKNAEIVGLFIMLAPAAEIARIQATIFAGLENGTLRPIVGQEMPLASAAEAHRAIDKSGAYGKIILIP
ncbi:zinc-containing alcohol dehydrogenase [Tolypothrix sp. NIES-4075]|uniref:NADPH:quinone reductase n=1 Tax=Tolypothrix sp. NIES-4075 TaxID=2005459 RepID=UPI000B5C97E8|nr:NADPH:quinone reductase [Tolypothrix sp. NIES-4075]GAX45504.1 zinc-containing alcohol dehydrogenase [Tolypothrix sp. NIES-4075]